MKRVCDGPTCHEHDGQMSHDRHCSLLTRAHRAKLAEAERLLEEDFAQFIDQMNEWAALSLPLAHETWPKS